MVIGSPHDWHAPPLPSRRQGRLKSWHHCWAVVLLALGAFVDGDVAASDAGLEGCKHGGGLPCRVGGLPAGVAAESLPPWPGTNGMPQTGRAVIITPSSRRGFTSAARRGRRARCS